MNIFYLDEDAKLAAQAMCDKHVVKMILESAQLLCTAHHLCPIWDLPDRFYKPTHKNHPCAKWVREQTANYCWLSQHAMFLCREYTHRYGKVHKSEEIVDWCNKNIANVPFGFGSKPALAMPDEYKCDDPVEAYRSYYFEYKYKTIKMTWTRRDPPEWWLERLLTQ